MRTMVIALKAPIPFTFSLQFLNLLSLSLFPQLQDSYDCKSKREKRKHQILKEWNKEEKSYSQLFNSHSLPISLSFIKFSKIGIGQMKKISLFFSILWLSLSLNYSLTHSLTLRLLFHARLKGLTCKVCILTHSLL